MTSCNPPLTHSSILHFRHCASIPYLRQSFSTTTERIAKALTVMKIFVRHLRTRPNIRSSLRAPPQVSPAHYQPPPHVPEGAEAESLARYKPPSKLSTPTRSVLQESRTPASRLQLQSRYRNRDYDAEEKTNSYTPRQRSREYEEEEISSYSPRQHAPRTRPQSQPQYQSYEENDEANAYSSRQRSPKSRAYEEEEDLGDYPHYLRTPKTEPSAETEPIERAPKSPKGPRVREPRLHLSDLIPESFTPYSYRWETFAPTSDELIDADRFFLKYPPKHLWSEAKFKKIDFGDVPEV